MPQLATETRLDRQPAAARYLGFLGASLLLTLAAVAAALYGIALLGLLPPVPLTGNLSFDEKARFVRQAPPGRCAIVAAGSSMTLNNLSSDILTRELPGQPRVLNLGAWNMTIADTRRWLRHVLPQRHPASVLLVSGPMDFYEQEPWFRGVSDRELDDFLGPAPALPLFARKFSLLYYASNWPRMREQRRSRTGYDSLAFDSGGGVPLEVYYPGIEWKRWNTATQIELLRDEQYRQLSLLAAELRAQGIGLVVAPAPMRAQSFAAAADGIARHWRRVEDILARGGQRFVDVGQALHLDDSCFADYSHLNAKGQAVFTRALAARLRTAP